MHAVEGSRVGHSATERRFEVLSFSCLSPCVFVLLFGCVDSKKLWWVSCWLNYQAQQVLCEAETWFLLACLSFSLAFPCTCGLFLLCLYQL